MIIKMKKTAVICLASEKEQALSALRDAGLLHVEISEMDSSTEQELAVKNLADAKRALLILHSVQLPKELPKNSFNLNGKELLEKVLDIDKQKTELNKILDDLKKKSKQLLPWGNFSFESIHDLNEKGCYVYLCSCMQDNFQKYSEKYTCSIVSENVAKIYFAVVSKELIPKGELPLELLPENVTLEQLNDEILKIEKQLSEFNDILVQLKISKSLIEDYVIEINDELEFFTNRDGMMQEGVLACINGYCPKPEIDKLKTLAADHGWGLQITEPNNDDNPPTLIQTPKIIKFSKVLFDFIGISPGYKEWDTSAVFLFFFTIFFSIIFGDAGYGAIFLCAGLFAKYKLAKKADEKINYYIKLFLLLSVGTIIWGFLSGSFFAIPQDKLPWWMQGIDWLTDVNKDKHVQQLCFIIAAIHLSLARVWKASLILNSVKCLGEIGWGMVLWGNYFVATNLIVYPDREWPVVTIAVLYGVGLLFVIVFGTNWFKMEEAFGFFFGLSGTFVDLLSYIRLFAVGLSSYYIANSFNDMGVNLLPENSTMALPFYIAGMVFIITFGHVLNILLGFLGVMVHGIRLNTLEFSNHMGLQWIGYAYQPFSKNKKNSEDDAK
jgi:V/A-type H+-transporting ATPase subunit I